MIGFLVPVPIYLYIVVSKSKPMPSVYNANGEVRARSHADEEYRTDVQKHMSPFKFLYEPYERRCSFHRIVSAMELFII